MRERESSCRTSERVHFPFLSFVLRALDHHPPSPRAQRRTTTTTACIEVLTQGKHAPTPNPSFAVGFNMANEHLASELPPPPIKPPHQSLAPLEYLQSQRRGSVTDPFLHASAQQPHHPPPDQSTPRHSEAYTNPRNGSYAFPPTNGHKTPENSSMNSNLDHPNGGGGGWTAQSGTGAPDQNLDHADPSAGRHGAGSPGRSGNV